MSKLVFISHAVKNKEIADQLVILLETGIGISDSDVFCSSLQGLGIPSGTNFVEFIRKQIQQPRVVILLLTQEYFHSQFCLSELGAAWVLSHRVIPLIVTPLETKDVKAVLTGIQLLKIGDKEDLNQMQADLIDALGIKGKQFARWEVNRDKFLAWLDTQNFEDTAPQFISPEQFEEMQEKYNDALTAIEELEEAINSKDTLIDNLKKTKDADEVKQIIKDSTDIVDQFEHLAEDAKEKLGKLPPVVQKAIYRDFKGEYLPYADPFDDTQKNEITAAVDNDYLLEHDEGLEPNGEDPKINRAQDALYELKNYIDGLGEDDDFRKYYVETYDHQLNFTSMRFWNTNLW